MNKIKLVSRCFKWFFIILLVVLPILYIAFWLGIPHPVTDFAKKYGISISFLPRGIPVLHTLSLSTKLLGLAISLLPLTIDLIVLSFLIYLFRCFERGQLFSLKNVITIKKIGYTILIGQLIHPLYDLLMSTTLTWHNPPGHRLASITFDNTNFGLLLIALLTILIAWIMAEGYQLKAEQDLTI